MNAPLTTLEKASSGRTDRESWRDAFAADLRDGALPGFLVIVVLVVAALIELVTGGPANWGLSRHSLSEGRWLTLLSHPLAHANHWHLLMNCAAVAGLTIAVRPLVGRGAGGWVRYLALLVGAGAASAAAYLLLHPSDNLPMVGASGAICGLWGLAVRGDPTTGSPHPLWSRPVGLGLRQFAVNNLILFGILFILARLTGGRGGLAWEAHLGGFAFGLFAAPWLVRPTAGPTASEPAATS